MDRPGRVCAGDLAFGRFAVIAQAESVLLSCCSSIASMPMRSNSRALKTKPSPNVRWSQKRTALLLFFEPPKELRDTPSSLELPS